MSRWTKEAALQELVTLVEETERLQGSYRLSAEHTRWFVRTRQFLDEVFGRRSIYLTLLTRLSWQPAGTFILESWDLEGALEARYYRAYLEALETAKGLLQAAHDELSVKTLEDVYHGKHTAPE